MVGLMLWVESGLKGGHGGLSNRTAVEGYCVVGLLLLPWIFVVVQVHGGGGGLPWWWGWMIDGGG